MPNVIPRVLDVCALDNWRLRVSIQDHGNLIVDIKPHLTFGVFRALQDVALFDQVKVAFGTVEWPNGIDIDPEWLLKNGVPESLVAEKIEPYKA